MEDCDREMTESFIRCGYWQYDHVNKTIDYIGGYAGWTEADPYWIDTRRVSAVKDATEFIKHVGMKCGPDWERHNAADLIRLLNIVLGLPLVTA